MSMKTTKKGTKKYTTREKLAILEEGKNRGVKVTLAKYGLYPATYYYWKKKHLVYGEEGLSHRSTKHLESDIKRLEQENEQLKNTRLVLNQAAKIVLAKGLNLLGIETVEAM